MQFSSASCYLLHLSQNIFFSTHSFLEHPKPMVFPLMWETLQNNRKNYNFVIFSLFSCTKPKDMFSMSHVPSTTQHTCSALQQRTLTLTAKLTSCFVTDGVCIRLFAIVQGSDSSDNTHFYISRNCSVVDWLVGLQWSPVYNCSDAVLSFT